MSIQAAPQVLIVWVFFDLVDAPRPVGHRHLVLTGSRAATRKGTLSISP